MNDPEVGTAPGSQSGCPEVDAVSAGDPLAPTAALLARLAAACRAEGFDLFATTTLHAYERRVPAAYQLGLGWPGDRALALIGNSRAAWPHFIAALDEDEALTGPLRAHPHPFDTWTIRRLTVALAPAAAHRHELRFAFSGPPHHFAALHLAEATGLAHRGPAGLGVHPTLGLWFGLRAALAIDLPWREAAAAPDLCSPCPAPCKAALDAALAASTGGGHPVRDHWRPWLAVRDACPVGREHRYTDAQIRWHYAHDRSALAPAAPGGPAAPRTPRGQGDP